MVDKYSKMIEEIRNIDVNKWVEVTIGKRKLKSSDLAAKFNIESDREMLLFESIFGKEEFVFDGERLSVLGLEHNKKLIGKDVTYFQIELMEMSTNDNVVEIRLIFSAIYYLFKKYEEYELRYKMQNVISPKFAPSLKNEAKLKCFGLYKIENENQYYFIGAQKVPYKTAEKKLLSKGATKIKKWTNVSHSIEVENKLKERLQELGWNVDFYHKDDDFVEEIEKIVGPNVNEELDMSSLKI